MGLAPASGVEGFGGGAGAGWGRRATAAAGGGGGLELRAAAHPVAEGGAPVDHGGFAADTPAVAFVVVAEGGGFGLGVGAVGVLRDGVGLDFGQRGNGVFILRSSGRGCGGVSPFASLYFFRSSETENRSLYNCFRFWGLLLFAGKLLLGW